MSEERMAAELAELRRMVTELSAQLHEARGRIDLTMRGQGRCSACGGERILHARQIADRNHGPHNEPLALRVRITSMFLGKSEVSGTLEAYVCAGCGAVEWYVARPEGIEVDGDIVTVHAADAPGDPYR